MSQILCLVLYILVLLVPSLCAAIRMSVIQMFTFYNEFLRPLSLADKNLSGDLLYGDELYFPHFDNSLHHQRIGVISSSHMYILDGFKGTYMTTVHYTIPWRWRQSLQYIGNYFR